MCVLSLSFIMRLRQSWLRTDGLYDASKCLFTTSRHGVRGSKPATPLAQHQISLTLSPFDSGSYIAWRITLILVVNTLETDHSFHLVIRTVFSPSFFSTQKPPEMIFTIRRNPSVQKHLQANKQRRGWLLMVITAVLPIAGNNFPRYF